MPALQGIVNEIAPMKDVWVKGYLKPWFESDIMEAIRVRDKLKERLLRTRLHVDHERFKEQHNLVQQKIKIRKQTSYEIHSKRTPKSLRNCRKY